MGGGTSTASSCLLLVGLQTPDWEITNAFGVQPEKDSVWEGDRPQQGTIPIEPTLQISHFI